jgi:UrcA family protein
MTNFASTFAGAATLALAALPFAALTTAAHAETTAAPLHIRIGDLDLSSKAGLREFDRRAREAGRRPCAAQLTYDDQENCLLAVRLLSRDVLARYLASQGRALPG